MLDGGSAEQPIRCEVRVQQYAKRGPREGDASTGIAASTLHELDTKKCDFTRAIAGTWGQAELKG